MTKQQEIEFFQAWVSGLPLNSYLRLYFGDETVQQEIRYCITNDFAAPDLVRLRSDAVAQRAEIKKLWAEHEEVRASIRALQEQKRSAEYALRTSRTEAGNFLQQLGRLESHLRAVAA